MEADVPQIQRSAVGEKLLEDVGRLVDAGQRPHPQEAVPREQRLLAPATGNQLVGDVGRKQLGQRRFSAVVTLDRRFQDDGHPVQIPVLPPGYFEHRLDQRLIGPVAHPATEAGAQLVGDRTGRRCGRLKVFLKGAAVLGCRIVLRHKLQQGADGAGHGVRMPLDGRPVARC